MFALSFYRTAVCVQFADALLRIQPGIPDIEWVRAQALPPLGRVDAAITGARFAVTYAPREQTAHVSLLPALAHRPTPEAQSELLTAAAAQTRSGRRGTSPGHAVRISWWRRDKGRG